MDNKLNDDMLAFLNENNAPTIVITRIVGLKIKDWDDDIGCIGEHYIVDCEIKGKGLKPRMCYVKRQLFNNFRNKSESIIWKDGQ